ncbi:hypothetical protein D3C75_1004070 [compost metagenome]
MQLVCQQRIAFVFHLQLLPILEIKLLLLKQPPFILSSRLQHFPVAITLHGIYRVASAAKLQKDGLILAEFRQQLLPQLGKGFLNHRCKRKEQPHIELYRVTQILFSRQEHALHLAVQMGLHHIKIGNGGA